MHLLALNVRRGNKSMPVSPLSDFDNQVARVALMIYQRYGEGMLKLSELAQHGITRDQLIREGYTDARVAEVAFSFASDQFDDLLDELAGVSDGASSRTTQGMWQQAATAWLTYATSNPEFHVAMARPRLAQLASNTELYKGQIHSLGGMVSKPEDQEAVVAMLFGLATAVIDGMLSPTQAQIALDQLMVTM